MTLGDDSTSNLQATNEARSVNEVNTLIKEIQAASGIRRAEAELALQAMLGFLSARLPSPVVGRIREALSETDETKKSGNRGSQC